MYTCPSCGCQVSNPHTCAARDTSRPDLHEAVALKWEEAADAWDTAAYKNALVASGYVDADNFLGAAQAEAHVAVWKAQALDCRARAAEARERGSR